MWGCGSPPSGVSSLNDEELRDEEFRDSSGDSGWINGPCWDRGTRVVAPSPSGWGELPLDKRIPAATLSIGLLALAAALVTVLAALAEIRHVFPQQMVRVFTISREYVRSPDPLYETHQLIFENPSDSPMINTSRIYVRLVRDSRNFISQADWSLQPSCVRYATSEHKPLVGDETEAIEIPPREAPFPGTWLPTRDPFRPPVYSDRLDWALERENPWFPSVLIHGPEVTLA